MSKPTSRDLASILMKEGKITKNNIHGERSYCIVEAFGKTFWIDNPFGKNPKISQLSDQQARIEKMNNF